MVYKEGNNRSSPGDNPPSGFRARGLGAYCNRGGLGSANPAAYAAVPPGGLLVFVGRWLRRGAVAEPSDHPASCCVLGDSHVDAVQPIGSSAAGYGCCVFDGDGVGCRSGDYLGLRRSADADVILD